MTLAVDNLPLTGLAMGGMGANRRGGVGMRWNHGPCTQALRSSLNDPAGFSSSLRRVRHCCGAQRSDSTLAIVPERLLPIPAIYHRLPIQPFRQARTPAYRLFNRFTHPNVIYTAYLFLFYTASRLTAARLARDHLRSLTSHGDGASTTPGCRGPATLDIHRGGLGGRGYHEGREEPGTNRDGLQASQASQDGALQEQELCVRRTRKGRRE